MAHSTASTKPEKPYEGFPLFPHATGRWAKKIRGKLYYFGPWADPTGAEAKFDLQRDDLYAGRTPRDIADGLTLHKLCNAFIAAKEAQRDAGDITPKTFNDYFGTCKFLLESWGKTRLVDDLAAGDFEGIRKALAKRLGAHALGRQVRQIKTLFKYGYEAALIDKPMRFGPTFKPPSKRTLRAVRQAAGPKMFEAREVRRLLKVASPQLKAMILLGCNCGFGNSDIGKLPLSAVDLQSGWINFPRPKTAVERRAPLWPETVAAMELVLGSRPKTKTTAASKLVFVTRFGGPWSKHTDDDPIAKEFAKLVKSLELVRRGRGFYALRHTFETIGGESRDQVAVNAVMGHADASMAAQYRERISDERLRAVTDFVRGWLFRRSSADLWLSRRPGRAK